MTVVDEPPYDEPYWHHSYVGEDPDTDAAIARVLDNLPTNVANQVGARCVFVSVGGSYHGQTLFVHKWRTDDWLIVLDNAAPHLEATIAHEIAHVVLHHGGSGDSRNRTTQASEAWEQAAAWGYPKPDDAT